MTEPEHSGAWYVGSLLQNCGCLVILLVVLGIILFFVVTALLS